MVLKQDDCIRALRAAHSRFYLSKTTLAVGVIGPGLIGGTLLDQLRDQVGIHTCFILVLDLCWITFENLITSKQMPNIPLVFGSMINSMQIGIIIYKDSTV